MADEDGTLTMDEILSGKPVEPAEPAELEQEQQEHEQQEQQASEEVETPETDAQTAAREGDDLPPWLDPEKDPEGASNWRALRESAKDFKQQAREQAELAEKAGKELADLRREVAELKRRPAQPAPEAPKLPPVDEDPEAHIAALREEMAQMRASQVYDRSEVNAIQAHGKAKVDAAFQRFQELPGDDPLRTLIGSSSDPWGLVVTELDRRDLLSEIGSDPAQYRAKVEAELRKQLEAEYAEKAKAEAADGVEKSIRERLPSSMASVPGAGQNASDKDNWSGPAPMSDVIGGGLDRYG